MFGTWIVPASRMAGVATSLFVLAGELRDGFERDALAALPDAITLQHVRDAESLAISAYGARPSKWSSRSVSC